MSIKLIIFDLDGTLIESTKDLHYKALNKALSEISTKYIISDKEHHTIYDALSTKQKLKLLTDNKGLDPGLHGLISSRKQEITYEMLKHVNFKLNINFKYLRKNKIKTAICTNSIRKTTDLIIEKLGIKNEVDLILTNEDVKNPKPDPDIFIAAMKYFNIDSSNTLIFEDSKYGIDAAEKTNSYVRIVKSANDLSTQSVKWALKLVNKKLFKKTGVSKTFIPENGSFKIKIICNICNKDRFINTNNIEHNKFTSMCKICCARKQYNPNKVDKCGYRLVSLFILDENDLKLAKPMVSAGDSIREHRLVMAKHLDRSLKKHEIVHHKNGIKHDNRIENLELLTKELHHNGFGDIFYQKLQEEQKIFKKFIINNMKVNVLIPMSGRGSRFKSTHNRPKPLIEIKPNLTMIELVVRNLNIDGKFIFLVLKEHYEQFSLKKVLTSLSDKIEIVIVDSVTEGAACTTLLAKSYINNDESLFIANSDQFVEDWNYEDFIHKMICSDADGGIVTFKANDNKWSYVKTDKINNRIIEVAEKVQISDDATVGFYWWKKGSDYVKYAEQMIEKNIRVNNEFYVAPTYNEAILDNLNIQKYEIKNMMGLGTPDDLNEYLRNYKNL